MARTTRPFRSVVAGISLALTLTLSLPDSASAIVPPINQPNWAELTPQQREILMPLSGEWDQLESFRRKKWLGIAQRYPGMKPDEQQRIQYRMKVWISLSPAERQQARDRYKSLQKAPPERRETVKQKWQEYKELPDAEKERLRLQAAHKGQQKSGLGMPRIPAAAARGVLGTQGGATAPSIPSSASAGASIPTPNAPANLTNQTSPAPTAAAPAPASPPLQ